MQHFTLFQRIALVTLFSIFSTQAPLALPDGPRLVLKNNFPDPAFIEDDGVFYAFATTNGNANVPIARSRDFETWEMTPFDAMPDMPEWSYGSFWAPHINKLAENSYVLYFSGGSKEDRSKHCVGTATSNKVTGPFKPEVAPFACYLKEGGAIDPAGFTDTDGTHWVVYKIDGNSLGGGGYCGNGDFSHSTPIMLQQVEDNGVTPIGAPIQILDRSDADGPLIEAPTLAKSKEGVYFLSFSSNCFNGPLYDISYATSTDKIQGPYTKSPQALLLPSDQMLSPGGATLSPNLDRIVFHTNEKYSDPGVRQMWVSPLSVVDKTSLRLSS